MIRRLSPAIALLVLFMSACGGGKNPVTGPTASTPPPPTTPAPTPTPPAPPPIPRVTLVGVVTNANTNLPVGSAVVSVTSTTNTSMTDGNGFFSIPGVAAGSVTVTISAANYNRAVETFTLPATDTRRDVRIVPFWTAKGTGNTVFDMPTYVSRVRITGSYPSNSTNFIIRIGGRLVVNELLGRAWGSTTYSGLHLTTGGVVEITNSRDVEWTFAQEQ
jgi:hypothetical protein